MRLRLRPEAPGSRPFDFLAIGENSLDLICVCQELPAPDAKSTLLRRIIAPGGQASTVAVGVSRLGFRSRYVGAVGDDAAGRVVTESLEREGVEACLVVRAGVETRSAVIVVDQRGRRSVLGARDERLNIAECEVGTEIFTSGRLLLVDGADLSLSHRAAIAARDAGVRTMVDLDTASREGLSLLDHIDAAIVAARFVFEATGKADLAEGIESLGRRSGAAVVVATEGERGAMAWCDGQIVEVQAEQVLAVDTTGAGDAFRAGFAAAWLRDRPEPPDLPEMLAFASRVAASNCRAFGAQAGLPRASEVDGPGEGLV